MKTKNRKNRSVKGTSVHLEIKMNSKINGITFKDIKSSKHHSSCCGRPRTVPQRRQDLAKKRPSALDALEWFSRCPLTILHPSMQPGSATIACASRFLGVKAANHHLETDLKISSSMAKWPGHGCKHPRSMHWWAISLRLPRLIYSKLQLWLILFVGCYLG